MTQIAEITLDLILTTRVKSLYPLYQTYIGSLPTDLGNKLGEHVRDRLIRKFCPEFVTNCVTCGGRTIYNHDLRRYVHFCSRECQSGSTFMAERTRAGFIAKHGMTPGQHLISKSVSAIRNASLNSEGTKAKRAQTIHARFGVDNAAKSETVQARIRRTNRERYGTDHHMQNSAQFKQWVERAYKSQQYLTADGRTLPLQGYEPIVADALEQRGWSVREARRGVHYEFENKCRVYHPDFVIGRDSRRLVIEVKSVYTLFQDWKRNKKKFAAIHDATDGRFALAVLLPKEQTVLMIRKPSQFTKVQMLALISGELDSKHIRRLSCP